MEAAARALGAHPTLLAVCCQPAQANIDSYKHFRTCWCRLGRALQVFKTDALNHSATLPKAAIAARASPTLAVER
jgi:hypothetical protein